MAAEVVLSVVEDASQRRVRPAHQPLQAIGGAEEVAFMDAFQAANAHKQVLIIVGHADDLMGHDLADGQDQVVAAFPNEAVELGRPWLPPIPSVALATNSAGTSPMVVTSVRQW